LSSKPISKFSTKILAHFLDIVIFVLGYFILAHPVYEVILSACNTGNLYTAIETNQCWMNWILKES